MRNYIFTVSMATLLLTMASLCQPVWSKNQPPAEGEPLPTLELPVPQDPTARKYLGISDSSNTFQPHQIDAEVVIINIFSMY